MPQHIYSAQAIARKVTKNKNTPNLYEKVNQILKGSSWGTSDLVSEMEAIITEEYNTIMEELSITKNKLLKNEQPSNAAF